MQRNRLPPSKTERRERPVESIAGDKLMREEATVNYHIKSEEPQAFYFDVDGIVGNLI